MINKSIKFLVITALTGGEVLIASTSVNDDKDFYTQYPCSCDKDDSHPGYCKKISALLKKTGLHTKLQQIKDIYTDCCSKLKQSNGNTNYSKEIKGDIYRSCPEIYKKNQKDLSTTFAQTLEKILNVIHIHDPNLPYLQGFSFIIAALMRHSTASITFGVFCYLMNNKNILPFTACLCKNEDPNGIDNTYQKNIIYILKKKDPQIFKYLNKYNYLKEDFIPNIGSTFVAFHLNYIIGDKNQINVIHHFIDKGVWFLYCLVVSEILFTHSSIENYYTEKGSLIHILTTYIDKEQDWERIIAQAEEIFTQAKIPHCCCPCY